MTWWYENEEEEMELYKNEDLCIECKNEFYSKPYDHRDPTPGQLGYCIKCDNCLIKEKKMEFDRSRVYSAVNADELRAGDKVIVGYTLADLKEQVRCGDGFPYHEIILINSEREPRRFYVGDGDDYPLAYLVERAENCTNCEELGKEGGCRGHGEIDKILCCDCYTPKTEQKAEKHYRPFRDTDELIKVWDKKFYLDFKPSHDPLTMPLIWVRYKMNQCGQMGILITKFEKNYVQIEGDMIAMHALMADYEFLDGGVCGVEE